MMTLQEARGLIAKGLREANISATPSQAEAAARAFADGMNRLQRRRAQWLAVMAFTFGAQVLSLAADILKAEAAADAGSDEHTGRDGRDEDGEDAGHGEDGEDGTPGEDGAHGFDKEG